MIPKIDKLLVFQAVFVAWQVLATNVWIEEKLTFMSKRLCTIQRHQECSTYYEENVPKRGI